MPVLRRGSRNRKLQYALCHLRRSSSRASFMRGNQKILSQFSICWDRTLLSTSCGATRLGTAFLAYPLSAYMHMLVFFYRGPALSHILRNWHRLRHFVSARPRKSIQPDMQHCHLSTGSSLEIQGKGLLLFFNGLNHHNGKPVFCQPDINQIFFAGLQASEIQGTDGLRKLGYGIYGMRVQLLHQLCVRKGTVRGILHQLRYSRL